MQYQETFLGKISTNMHNRILGEYGGLDIISSKQTFLDPALKLFHNIPLMCNTNNKINEQLANGTLCHGVYIRLNSECRFQQDYQEEYMINTTLANNIDHTICRKDK